MKTIKKLLFWLVSYSIRLVLFATISVAVTVVIVGKSGSIKDVLTQTNSYSRFVPAVIDANKAAPQTASSLNYDDPAIVKIFTDSFPASDLKSQTEGVIDNIYAWLNGQTTGFHFKADFTKNKALLAAGLSDYAFNRLEKLPFCKTLPEEVNPLTINCQPKAYNLKEVKESYRQELLSSDSFLSKTVLTEKDLPKNTAGKTLAEQYSFAPKAFHWLLKSPYILGGLTLLFGVLYILLSPKKRRGVAGIGAILMSSGVSLALFPILTDIVLPHFTNSFQPQSGTQGTQAIYSDVIAHVTHHFYTLFITIGIQMVIAGLSIYLLEKATRNEVAKYKNIEKKSGVSSSNERANVSPKSLRGKLSYDNIPVQTSDLPAKLSPKNVADNAKYSKIFGKKK